jgi:autotransporter adhesin
VVAKSFRSGDVHISANEVNAGGNKVTNVAPGTISATSTDAINGSQLHQTNQNVTNLDNKVTNLFGDMQSTMNEYKKDLSAGIAGVNAAASLPQAHRAGQSSVAAALGYYNDQSALAVGVSTISDSGRWTIKGQVNMNTSGDLGAGAGVAYNF